MSDLGIAALSLVLPAAGVSRAALMASRGREGGRGARRIAGSDEDLLTLAYDAAAALGPARDAAAPLLWAAGGLNDGLARPGAVLGRALRHAGAVVQTTGGLRSGWDLLAAQAGAPSPGAWAFSDVRDALAQEPVALNWSDAAAALTVGTQPGLVAVASLQHERPLGTARQQPGHGLVESDYNAFTLAAEVTDAVAAVRDWAGEGSEDAVWAIAAGAPAAAKKLARKPPSPRTVVGDPQGVGFCGVAEPAFLLAAAAGQARAGDRVILVICGEGWTAIEFRATDRVGTLAVAPRWAEPQRTVGPAVWNDCRGRHGVASGGPALSPQLADLNAPWALDRQGGRCAACGELSFPLAPRCHVCGAEGLTPEPIGEHGEVFTFTIDHLHPALESPTTMIVADLDGGGRVYLQGTDDLMHDVRVGVPVEWALRRLHMGEDGRTPHYFWKLRGRP